MTNQPPVIDQVRAVIASYLSGGLDFDTALEQLVRILRSIRESQALSALFPEQRQPGQPISIMTLSAEQWQNPPQLGAAVQVKLLELAPGHPPREQQRARAVFAAAWRRAFGLDK